MKESNYIRYRKIKAFGTRLCFYLCRIFPIKPNLISVCTFEGKGGFGCNPKYIVQELHKRNPRYEFVWFVNDMTKEFPDYIKKVPNTLWSRAYWLSRSKIWIDNYRKPYGTCKRKGQYYLNTWHGMGGFKTIGLWRGDSFSEIAYLVSKKDSDMVDYFLSDSKFCTEYFPKGLVYSGEFLEVGAPRCDVLLNQRNSLKTKFYNEYDLEEDIKCIMYAPTYRENAVNGKRRVFSEIWSIDFDKVIQNLETHFGGTWCIILRMHPQIAHESKYIKNKVIDVSDRDDLYEILAAMDGLITDYSSCAMDAAMMRIPVFIYADDIGVYKENRGALTWDITEETRCNAPINKEISPNFNVELPFSIAKNNDELEEDILQFNVEGYDKKLTEYERGIGLVLEGTASKKVANIIEELMYRY